MVIRSESCLGFFFRSLVVFLAVLVVLCVITDEYCLLNLSAIFFAVNMYWL